MSVSADSHTVMRSADLILVASGTASLEAALLGTPMVIVYKVSTITHLVVRAAIALGLIESYTVGLPNLVLRRRVVPEALQTRATSAIVADEAWGLLSHPARLERMRADLAAVAERAAWLPPDCRGGRRRARDGADEPELTESMRAPVGGWVG